MVIDHYHNCDLHMPGPDNNIRKSKCLCNYTEWSLLLHYTNVYGPTAHTLARIWNVDTKSKTKGRECWLSSKELSNFSISRTRGSMWQHAGEAGDDTNF